MNPAKAAELEHFKNAATHLSEANRCIDLAYFEVMAPRRQGADFSDETYALGVLQQQLHIMDTMLYRKIEELKGAPRKMGCGCCLGGCVCFSHHRELPTPQCAYHQRKPQEAEDE